MYRQNKLVYIRWYLDLEHSNRYKRSLMLESVFADFVAGVYQGWI